MILVNTLCINGFGVAAGCDKLDRMVTYSEDAPAGDGSFWGFVSDYVPGMVNDKLLTYNAQDNFLYLNSEAYNNASDLFICGSKATLSFCGNGDIVYIKSNNSAYIGSSPVNVTEGFFRCSTSGSDNKWSHWRSIDTLRKCDKSEIDYCIEHPSKVEQKICFDKNKLNDFSASSYAVLSKDDLCFISSDLYDEYVKQAEKEDEEEDVSSTDGVKPVQDEPGKTAEEQDETDKDSGSDQQQSRAQSDSEEIGEKQEGQQQSKITSDSNKANENSDADVKNSDAGKEKANSAQKKSGQNAEQSSGGKQSKSKCDDWNTNEQKFCCKSKDAKNNDKGVCSCTDTSKTWKWDEKSGKGACVGKEYENKGKDKDAKKTDDSKNESKKQELKKPVVDAAKLKAANEAREKLNTFFKKIDSDRSVWKNADGSFNATRLASDLTAGVVLGTVGGVVSGVLIKKSQVEKGFDALNCSINGQKVADWGDEFSVGLRR